MSKTTAPYRNYTGSIEYSEADGVFHGKVLNVTDLVSYEADDEDGIQRAFEEAVDDYLSILS